MTAAEIIAKAVKSCELSVFSGRPPYHETDRIKIVPGPDRVAVAVLASLAAEGIVLARRTHDDCGCWGAEVMTMRTGQTVPDPCPGRLVELEGNTR